VFCLGLWGVFFFGGGLFWLLDVFVVGCGVLVFCFGGGGGFEVGGWVGERIGLGVLGLYEVVVRS